MIARTLRNERGVALPLAAAVMLVLSLLVVALSSNAIQASGSANKDRNTKRALAAAEAGLQVANYRLNAIGPNPASCLTDRPVRPDRVTGECPAHSVDLGNGAQVTYYVTPQLPQGATCGSVPGQLLQGEERCITATGSVNGVARRLQARVLTQPASPPLLKVDGILGQDKIEIGNNSLIGGNVGSNGLIMLGNNGVIDYAELAGPNAHIQAVKLTQDGPPILLPDPYQSMLPPIQGTESPCPNGLVVQGCNNNAAIPLSKGYLPQSRILNLTSELILPAGDYNFCRIDFGNNDGANLRAAPGATVRIFIDVPDPLRPGSGCSSDPGIGSVEGKNGIMIGQPDDPPENLQIYRYGWPNTNQNVNRYGVSEITVAKNNLQANAMIYAPQSNLNVGKNDAIVKGAITAREIYIKNNLEFNWDDDLKWVGYASGRFDRQGWRECKAKPTNPADPESGC